MNAILRNPFLLVQDLIGDKSTWPKYVLYSLFCSKLQYRDQVILGPFFYGNGLDMGSMLEMVAFVNSHYSKEFERKMKALYELWEDSELDRSRRTYYDLILKRVVDLNGDPITVEQRGTGIVNDVPGRGRVAVVPAYDRGRPDLWHLAGDNEGEAIRIASCRAIIDAVVAPL